MQTKGELVFPMAEYERRLRNLRALMEQRGMDAVILTMPHDLFYLTGYQTPGYYWFQALVVPLEKEPFMVTRRLEASNVAARTWIKESRPYRDFDNPPRILAEAIAEFGLADARLGYDRDAYFFRAFEQETVKAALPDATFVNGTGVVEQLRVIKSDAEIATMEQAARATEAGMRAGIEAVAVGVSENDIAAAIYGGMLRAGSEWPAMAPFVASGWRGALGHATWERRVIEKADSVFLEVAGCYHRYHAAMMRTVVVGEPPRAMVEAEKVCLEAMQATMAAIKPGIPASQIDTLARNVIAAGAPNADQASRTGYSIGIGFPPDWGEGHILSMVRGHDRPLEQNMTFHLIPWVQVPGHGGVGLTETIVVTETGCRSLFNFERRVFRAPA